jgi:circadian clock protein KaiC
MKRVSTGNPQADEILHGGFPKNSINIIMGQPGTGKSIFAEQLVFQNASDDPTGRSSTSRLSPSRSPRW